MVSHWNHVPEGGEWQQEQNSHGQEEPCFNIPMDEQLPEQSD